MSLQTPTTKDINQQIISQLEASLAQTIPLLPKAFYRVLSRVLSGVFILLYKYGGFIFLQLFVKTASDQPTMINGKEIVPLFEWGRLVGLGGPTGATNAELRIDVIVENQTGTLPAYSQLVNTTNGVTYITLGDVLLNAPNVQVNIRAASDQTNTGGAGVQGNLEPGAIVSFANPLPNVAKNATVLNQVVTGADAEETEIYRQRILDYFQARPQGGSYSDLRLWAEEVEGIVNAYPYTAATPGQVDVFSEATVASSGNEDGIPTQAQLEAVLESINYDQNGLANRRPADMWVNSLPITRTAFDVNVSGINGVDNVAQVRTDIETALTNYFFNVEPFIPGLYVPPRNDQITQTRVSAIVEDIVTGAGGTFTGAMLFLNPGFEIEFYVLTEGEKAKLNILTFI